MNLTSRTGRGQAALVVSITAALLVVTALLFTVRGSGDMKIWERWTGNAMRLGVVEGFRENDNDYPPLSDVILWVTGHAGNAAGLPVATSTKLSLVIFLAATLILVRRWLTRDSLTLGLWSVLVLNVVGMGYLDVYSVPPLVLSLWALQQARATAAITWFTVACLIKWQPLIVGPFLMLHVGRAYWPLSSTNVRRLPALLAPSILLLVVAVTVFEPYPFFRAFAKSLGHRVLSGDALNLPWIATWLHQGFNQGVAGLTSQVASLPDAPLWLRLVFKLLFAWQFLFLLYRYVNGPVVTERTLAYSLAGFLAYVTLSSGVHENHWFVPSFLAIVLLQYGRRWLRPAVAVGVFANLNLVVFYGITGRGAEFSRVVGVDVTVPMAALAVAIYIWIATLVRRIDRTGWDTAAAGER